VQAGIAARREIPEMSETLPAQYTVLAVGTVVMGNCFASIVR